MRGKVKIVSVVKKKNRNKYDDKTMWQQRRKSQSLICGGRQKEFESAEHRSYLRGKNENASNKQPRLVACSKRYDSEYAIGIKKRVKHE